MTEPATHLRDTVRAFLERTGALAGPAGDIGNGKGGDGSVNDTPIEYLSTREAAAFLGLSPRTLDRYRVTGQGPVFHKFGTRIRYTRGDLDAWAAARRMTSTSDVRASGERAP